MESLAFALFGLACLGLYAGAKSLDDRDRARNDRTSAPPPPPQKVEHTLSFATGERLSRASDRPEERESFPPR